MTTVKLNIKNIPEYAKNYKYWVVNLVDKELYFYGAYNDNQLSRVEEALKEVDYGFMVEL